MSDWTVYGVNLELVDVWRIDVEAEDAAQAPQDGARGARRRA
jgi:hypothetical protein